MLASTQVFYKSFLCFLGLGRIFSIDKALSNIAVAINNYTLLRSQDQNDSEIKLKTQKQPFTEQL